MVALVAISGLAQAREGNVFSLKLSELLQYDDNIFRLSPDADNRQVLGSDRRDDFISSTTVALDANKQVGRHNFYGELSYTQVLFQEFRRLDYTGENSRLGWSGGFGAANNWDVYFKRSATQSDFADLQTALSNVVTTDTIGGSMSIRVASDWVVRPALSEDKYSNSADSRKSSDGSARHTSLNFGYRPHSGNALEAQYRHLDRDYDVGGGFRQKEIGVLGVWMPSSASVLEIRGARLVQKTKIGGGNGNFSQQVGHFNYRWQTSGASTLNFRVFRELSSVNIVGAEQDALARGVTGVWSWTPLAKVKFDSTYDYRKRTFQQITLRDKTRTASLGATYFPDPALSLQAIVKNERRKADPNSREYEAQSYSLSLQYSF